ncbi:hypothetical protein BC628DRAFT_549512 [Trametes gibbosa]|nr:hypothetical protein BC628DRAFT_549512 [Trametes gibbosa]
MRQILPRRFTPRQISRSICPSSVQTRVGTARPVQTCCHPRGVLQTESGGGQDACPQPCGHPTRIGAHSPAYGQRRGYRSTSARRPGRRLEDGTSTGARCCSVDGWAYGGSIRTSCRCSCVAIGGIAHILALSQACVFPHRYFVRPLLVWRPSDAEHSNARNEHGPWARAREGSGRGGEALRKRVGPHGARSPPLAVTVVHCPMYAAPVQAGRHGRRPWRLSRTLRPPNRE